MTTLIVLLGIAVVVIAGTALADRLRIAAPMLLIALGIAVSYVPHVPQVHLQPEVVLLGLLPPLLYATAIQTSIIDLRANFRTVVQLSVLLVLLTTATVAAVVMLLVPDVGWPVALAIGAVVAPPDAVAATAVARRIGLPRDVVSILEAESLLNDATALVALRTAIVAMAAAVSWQRVGLDFVVAAGGGVLVGLLVFIVVAKVRKLLTSPLLDTSVSFITPFTAYLVAEQVHASGVIAVVVAGILLGHKAATIQSAQSRLNETLTWRTISFLLENAVFLLIGLQAREILGQVAESVVPWPIVLAVCAATLACVILVRMVFVLATQALANRLRTSDDRMPPRHAVVIGWAGMRGVVTLAAALILPEDTPQRPLLILLALVVVLGTLFGQGLTLPIITRALKVRPPDPAVDALARATLLQQAGEAALVRLDELDLDNTHGMASTLRNRLDQRTFAAWERLSTQGADEAPSEQYARARLAMLEAERARVLEIRNSGNTPSDVVREVLGMLDLEESMIDNARSERATIRASGPDASLGSEGGDCEDLRSYPAVDTDEHPVCRSCIEQGLTPVALRQCLTCGHIGCCDSSKGRHATKHFRATGHPVMESAEPGEHWRWCYVHSRTS
ncbi:Na+/H+ antiporter [Aestuariimicrobium kwangyangense]|uniref:Na+/H+ antiporter n=1 Tax=Aestuariimicrobium kwangyangense TaxID=396389 RepID=UPI0003B6FA5D|nr:Na+/H+ antiporter [Aestuariimicrobium kwangyangense]